MRLLYRHLVASLVLVVVVVAVSASSAGRSLETRPPVVTPVLLREVPRDPGFTQGLAFARDGYLYESTGLYGASSVRRIDPATGRVLGVRRLPDRLFGEGLAVAPGGGLVQLTWHAGLAFRYSLPALEIVGQHRYRGEGWGLCATEGVLVMSDGSSFLVLRDAFTFRPFGRVQVVSGGRPVRGLNELECVGPHVYANVWRTPRIVRLLLDTGVVDLEIDVRPLAPQPRPPSWGVANGIAHHPGRGTFFLTGKGWPVLYEVVFPTSPAR